MKKLKIGILLIMCLFPISTVYAAGTASISVDSSVVNGNNITATVTLKNMAAWNIKIVGTGATSGCSVKQVGDSGNGNNTTKSFSLTCKATEIGTITFSFSGDITSADGSNVNVSGSKKVSVVKPREKSTNNNLKSLSVEGYNLSPEFHKNTLEYTVELESSVEKIKINASKEDGYASLSGTGEKDVQEGDNKFEITVTSETGNSKVYTVNAIVKDSNPIVKEVDNKTYTVVKRASALTKPDLFESTTVMMNEIQIPAFYNELTDITLIGLKNENGEIALFKYDASQDKLMKYESVTSTTKTIIFEDTDKVMNGYIPTSVTVDDKVYNAYQHPKDQNYMLIYGIDLETGDKGWYLYHVKEKTVQSYMGNIISSMEEEFDNTLKEYKMVLLGMVALSLLLLLIVIIQIVSKNKLKRKFLKKMKSSKESIDTTKNKDAIKDTNKEVKNDKSVKTKNNK